MQPVAVCFGLQVVRAHLAIVARELELADKLIDPAIHMLTVHASHTPQLAEALVTKGDLLSLRGDKVRSFELYEQALVVQAHLWGATSVRLAQERYILATALTQVGRFAQALQEFQKAYDALVNALGKEHVKTALVELQLGQWQAAIFGSAEGRAHVVHASQLLLARTAMVDQRTIYMANRAMAELALFDGQIKSVQPYLDEAMRLQAELGDKWPIDGHLETLKAWYLDDLGRGDEARNTLQLIRLRLVTSFGASHLFVRDIDEALASSYMSEKRWADAEALFKSSSAGQGAEPRSSGWTALLMAQGKFEQARHFVEAHYQELRQTPRGDQFRLSLYGAQDQMGRLYAGLGQHGIAAGYFQEAIHSLENGYPANPYLAMTRARYGLSLLQLKDAQGARVQQALAAKALAANPNIAAYFREPLKELQNRLGSD